ncbi:MAG TPA: hypothetical protein VHM88_19910, partial [Candidatus Acidoferrales bacterium]|nr:hypothetical protein [Candidatus Acidoferrales bacterium]
MVSRDWTLRVTVRAELRHVGLDALGMESAEDVAEELAHGKAPSAVVLDAASEAAALSHSASRAALTNLAKRVPLLVVASRVDQAPPLEGAAAVLYRPVRVGEIVARLQQLLE